MKTIVYECKTPLKPGQEFMAFLVQDAWELDAKGRRTGAKVDDILPVRFFGATALAAETRAMTFWNEETAKEAAKSEMGKVLGESRRSQAA